MWIISVVHSWFKIHLELMSKQQVQIYMRGAYRQDQDGERPYELCATVCLALNPQLKAISNIVIHIIVCLVFHDATSSSVL